MSGWLEKAGGWLSLPENLFVGLSQMHCKS